VKENENRMAPWQIMNSVNELAKNDPKIYSVTCISAKWTEAGNIVLKFDNKTKPDNVRKAGASICQRLSHGRTPNEIKLAENILWSKIVLRGVPCRNHPNQDMDTDEDHATAPLWPMEVVDNEIKSNPVLAKLNFAAPHSWTKATVEGNNEKGGVIVTFEDADGSLAREVEQSAVFMFAQEVRPIAWKEPVDLTQCTRCWNFSRPHEKCHIVCRICASTAHDETQHKEACMTCHHAHGKDAVLAPEFTCPHTRCKHCNGPHPANDTSCKARDHRIREVRAKKGSRIPDNQPILDLTMYSTSWPRSGVFAGRPHLRV
jgi:hypothetical protein